MLVTDRELLYCLIYFSDFFCDVKNIYFISGVYLDYSLDKGITWKPVYKSCLPSNVDCNKQYYPDSSFKSDVNWGWNRINAPLPYYTK